MKKIKQITPKIPVKKLTPKKLNTLIPGGSIAATNNKMIIKTKTNKDHIVSPSTIK